MDETRQLWELGVEKESWGYVCTMSSRLCARYILAGVHALPEE